MQAEKLLEISNEIESKETETSQRQQACYQPPIYSERFDNNFEGPLAGMQLCSLMSLGCICLDDSRLKVNVLQRKYICCWFWKSKLLLIDNVSCFISSITGAPQTQIWPTLRSFRRCAAFLLHSPACCWSVMKHWATQPCIVSVRALHCPFLLFSFSGSWHMTQTYLQTCKAKK